MCTLLLPRNDALLHEARKHVCSHAHAVFQCQRAIVVSIESMDGTRSFQKARSFYAPSFVYRVGQWATARLPDVAAEEFAAGPGIHYFVNKEHARTYDWRRNQHPQYFPCGALKPIPDNQRRPGLLQFCAKSRIHQAIFNRPIDPKRQSE